MGTVAGVDISMTSTGIAVINEAGLELTWPVKAQGHRGDTIPQRLHRLRSIAYRTHAHLVELGMPFDLIVVEAPSYNQPGGSTHDRSGLWWLVVHALEGIAPIATVPPSTLKKYATGNGSASKTQMATAARLLFPQLTLREPVTDDEVDALYLAEIGSRRLGRPIGSAFSEKQSEAFASTGIEWPALEGKTR